MTDCRWRTSPADEENDHEWCETHGFDWPCPAVLVKSGAPAADDKAKPPNEGTAR